LQEFFLVLCWSMRRFCLRTGCLFKWIRLRCAKRSRESRRELNKNVSCRQRKRGVRLLKWDAQKSLFLLNSDHFLVKTVLSTHDERPWQRVCTPSSIQKETRMTERMESREIQEVEVELELAKV
jgi:hypothetical protein